MRLLSELEGAVLGQLSKLGPATAYRVRREFALSPSSHWSGSAGAVYPALARLERLGLVASRRAPTGERPARDYSLTRKGRARLLSWIEPPFPVDVISIAPDPIRTRVSVLSVLPPARRALFLERAITELRRSLESLEPPAACDDDGRRALAGAVAVTRARIAWLESLKRSHARA